MTEGELLSGFTVTVSDIYLYPIRAFVENVSLMINVCHSFIFRGKKHISGKRSKRNPLRSILSEVMRCQLDHIIWQQQKHIPVCNHWMSTRFRSLQLGDQLIRYSMTGTLLASLAMANTPDFSKCCFFLFTVSPYGQEFKIAHALALP